MRTELLTIENWTLVTIPNEKVKKDNFCPTTAEQLVKAGYSPIKATVPGNFELDVMSEKDVADIYFGTNVLKAMELEKGDLTLEFLFKEKKIELTAIQNGESQEDTILIRNLTLIKTHADGIGIYLDENMYYIRNEEIISGDKDMLLRIFKNAGIPIKKR